MLKKIKYYSLYDIIDYSGAYPYSDAKYNGKTKVSNWFKSLLSDYDMAYSIIGLNSLITSSIYEAIIEDLMLSVWNRHGEDYIYSVRMGFESSHSLSDDDLKKVLNKIINVLNNTAPKYIPMFQAVKDNNDNLVKKAESISISDTRFNDTPQNQGSFNDEDHATTETHFVNNASADTGSIMDRLSSMFSNFRSVILDWSNEFNMLFLNDAQIDWRDYYED